MSNPSAPTLVDCPACQTKVSSQAASCPRCGQPMSAPPQYQPAPRQFTRPEPQPKKGMSLSMGCLALIGVGFLASFVVGIFNPDRTRRAAQNPPAQTASPPMTEAEKEKEKKAEERHKKLSEERLLAVDEFFSQGAENDAFYHGTSQRGKDLTIYVREGWNFMSVDQKTAFLKQWLSMWAAIGANRGLEEDVGSFRVKLVHKDSGRTVGTWDGLFGPRFKD